MKFNSIKEYQEYLKSQEKPKVGKSSSPRPIKNIKKEEK